MAVAVAAAREQLRRTQELFGASGRRGRLRGERVDGGERRVGVARGFAQASERLERLRVLWLDRERGFVGPDRAIGRGELLGEQPRALEQDREPARRVGDELLVALVELHGVLPALERTVVARERAQRGIVAGIELEHFFERARRLVVVEEFLLVDGGDALPERDLLARRRGGLDLDVEVREQVLEASGLAEQPIEPAQRVEVARVQVEHGLVAALGFGVVAELELVELRDTTERLELLFAALSVRAALEDFDEPAVVARALAQAYELIARRHVAGILGQDGLDHAARAQRVAQVELEQIGRFGAVIARERGARRGVGAPREHGAELRPLLSLAVDLRHAVEGRVVRRVDADDGLVAREREIRAL
jgi:hypothetical protein